MNLKRLQIILNNCVVILLFIFLAKFNCELLKKLRVLQFIQGEYF